jgi:RNA polymerase-binding transcription factor DksA
MRDQATSPTELELALERLRAPDYGTCEACGSEMPYVAMLETPGATLCPACRARRS